MRQGLYCQRKWRRTALIVAIAGLLFVDPRAASAQGLFDFFFGGIIRQQEREAPPPQTSFFADPFGNGQPAAPPRPAIATSGPAFCVRSCDGRYFPLPRGNASPVQTCQSFCPASPTNVFYGSNIDSAFSASGERYADSANAFAYRRALRADCTCNGRDPAGLAPVDLTLDTSLRAGDVVATTDGLVAFTGVRTGNDQTAEFTPVASYPGLTPDVRARLGEMKVAPVKAELTAGNAPEVSRQTPAPGSVASRAEPLRDTHAD